MGYTVRVLGHVSGYMRYFYLKCYSKHGCVLGEISEAKEYKQPAYAARAAEELFNSQLSQSNFDYLKVEVVNSLTDGIVLQLTNSKRQAEVQESQIQMTDNEAALHACKSGVLPNRQRVKAVFGLIFLVLLSLLLTASLVLMMGQYYADSTAREIIFFFLVVTVGFSILIIGRFLLCKPKIEFIEGQVLKSHKRIGLMGEIEQFWLTCNGQQFLTDFTIWHEIEKGKKYRLWYSSRQVVAFESLEEKQGKAGLLRSGGRRIL